MAGIQPVDIVAPGAFGLNTESKDTLLRPQWATKADNAVVSRSGRLASRLGWADQTSNAISGTHTIDVLHEYLDKSGNSVIISTANNKIYKDIDDFTDAGNDITSTTAPTADHWQFVNFNGKCLGFQKGHAPIERTSGDFSDASYTGTGPDGNCAVAAFGRIWAADADLQTVRYSALLDDTDYSTASGGGTLDMSSVWTGGMDEIVAITAIGSNLVVFGRNHIVMWGDGSGSELGITPTRLAVVDTIEGTGCIARDSIAITGEGDLMFLSRHGVQSLGRVIQFKSNPLVSLSRNVRADILLTISTSRASDARLDAVRAAVSPEDGYYVLNFPTTNEQYVFDIRHPFDDDEGETVFPVTRWVLGGNIAGMLSTVAGKLYFGSAGVVGLYSTKNDDSSGYPFTFESGWLDFEDLNHRLKMLKEILASVVIGSGSLTWTWEFDFSGSRLERTVSYSEIGGAEWGVAEWGIAEWSGGTRVQRRSIAAHGEGQFLKVGVTATISGNDVILQHISVAPKLGRLVT